MSDLKAAVREEMSKVGAKLELMDKRLCSCESLQSSADARIDLLERKLKSQHQKLLILQLQAEDSENRSRRNNVRIKGISETIKTPDLRKTAIDIFNKHLGNPSDTHIELDRVHRSPAGLVPEQGSPRDVLCRVHFYKVKEDIMRAVWQKGALEFAGQEVQMFPDLSRQTKIRRRLMRPLLDQIQANGATYRWGYPLSLIIKKDERAFILSVPEQLPDLFKFLGSEVVEVPDWVDISIETMGGGITNRRNGRGEGIGRRKQNNWTLVFKVDLLFSFFLFSFPFFFEFFLKSRMYGVSFDFLLHLSLYLPPHTPPVILFFFF